MYRDVVQWWSIRDHILNKSVSIRQVSRETGISHKTVRKMLGQTSPQRYGKVANRLGL
jgi:lambda repressor-like predicted transcriptional regulator